MKGNLGDGKGRIGSGNKMMVNLHEYGRSTHNLTYAWRSTMAPGTLVPFLVEPLLKGGTKELEISVRVMTHPTVGPIMGFFKIECHIFEAAMRLYNRQLHNNKFGIGMHMNKVLLPIMKLRGRDINTNLTDVNTGQVSPDSLIAYLGTMGLGKRQGLTNHTGIAQVVCNQMAMPLLMYWDIYKNYYANKQEGIGYVVGRKPGSVAEPEVTSIVITRLNGSKETIQNLAIGSSTETQPATITLAPGESITLEGKGLAQKTIQGYDRTAGQKKYLEDFGFNEIIGDENGDWITYEQAEELVRLGRIRYQNAQEWQEAYIFFEWDGITIEVEGNEIELQQFDLSLIDDMRETILSHPNTSPLTLGVDTANGEILTQPYEAAIGKIGPANTAGDGNFRYTMAGLGIKTYNSDRFNNWLDTEWIDGEGGITQITSVDTTGDSFTMDSLNAAQKIYNLLNRVAARGGSYYDWLEATTGELVTRNAEMPMYMGGCTGEIGFAEVVSTAKDGSGEEPLGTLAGRGTLRNSTSGQIKIKADEHVFVMGLVSITPFQDVSQGNKWYTRLETMDDWHKPELDGIGYQELLTDEMAAFDTERDANGNGIYRSAGKQTSFIEYQTEVNRTYGNFARTNNEMFLTLNRQYQCDEDGNIEDLTTYIDPEKYDYIFAYRALGAQNFWVQILVEDQSRLKMSASQIPSL